MQMEFDRLLNSQEKKEVITRLKSLNFGALKINGHYNNKYGQPRHGISTEKAKEIFMQFDKIYTISTRPGIGGKRYTIIYRLNKNKSYFILLLLDENPVQLFDAYFYNGDIEKRMLRKYAGV